MIVQLLPAKQLVIPESDLTLLLQGRIITGLGVGALSAVVPLYQSETAPKEIRGTCV